MWSRLKLSMSVLQSLVLCNSDCQLEEISLVQRLRENIMAALYDCLCVVRYMFHFTIVHSREHGLLRVELNEFVSLYKSRYPNVVVN